jgi:hypothetical protein
VPQKEAVFYEIEHHTRLSEGINFLVPPPLFKEGFTAWREENVLLLLLVNIL